LPKDFTSDADKLGKRRDNCRQKAFGGWLAGIFYAAYDPVLHNRRAANRLAQGTENTGFKERRSGYGYRI